MKFCQHCGKEIMDEAVVCPNCGCSVQTVNRSPVPVDDVDESVSAGLVVLAILIPLFGFIYWPVKAKTRPKCAMICGIAAIVSWFVSFVFLSSMMGI